MATRVRGKRIDRLGKIGDVREEEGVEKRR
jgi:hypothetical protein